MKRTIVFVLVVGLFIGGCARSPLGGDRLAVINDRVITKEDLEVRRKIYELFFRQSMDNPGSKQQLLDQMVNERLLLDQVEKFDIIVTDTQVGNEMERFFSVLDRQYKGREEVTKRLQDLGLTNDIIAAYIRDFLLNQAVIDRQKALVTVSADEVQAFYEQNREMLFTFQEESVRAAHVLIPVDQEAQAREISAKARVGGDFAQLAKQYSVDPGSSRVGGDLGYFIRGTMVKEFSDVAFALKTGEISDPVRSQFGWHVIRVVDKQGPGVVPYEKAKEDAANRLLPQKQDQAFEEWLRGLSNASKVEKVLFVQSPGRK